MFSVVLSPDCSEPSLAATLSFGVRTFLPPLQAESDCLIYFSLRNLALASSMPLLASRSAN
jgi:hypothetical protein